jgi:hypothetical protein
LIHQHPNVRNIVLNESTNRLTIKIEEIEKVNSLKFFAKKSTTRIAFYPEDAEWFLLVQPKSILNIK